MVDFVSDQAKKVAGEEVGRKLKQLRSDAAFNKQFEEGLQRAIQRFVAEYELEDEDLVSAIAADKDFFKNEAIQKALLAILKKPGTYLGEDREKIAQSFESVLPNRRNRERVDKAVTFLLQCLAEELWHLPELQPVFSLQFQRVTAEATREQVVLARQQLEATTQLSLDMRQALLQLSGALEKNLLTAPVRVSLPSPKPYHNLPRPDYSRFIGRESELDWLRQRLSPTDRAWQVAINGIGGVGKSALALAIAHEYRENYSNLSPQDRFEALIWISAKEEVLTVQGREQAALPELVLRTLEDVYTAIARALDREDITLALPDGQGQIVDKVLKEQRTLLIMDNLESVKDERIKPFLRNLPAPTKAIITSREWLDVADVLPLKGLSADEADGLIEEEANIRKVTLYHIQRERIYELTSGIPLAIKLAVARIAGGESFPAVIRWLGDAVGDLPEYCIRGQADLARQRDQNAWRLLLACSLFDRGAGASREALGFVADLSLAERDNASAQLRRLFLINQTERDRFWVLPIVQRFASVQLVAEETIDPLITRWIEWLTAFAMENSEEIEWQAEKIEGFRPEYQNILNGIRWCQKQQHWQSVIDLAEHTWGYTYIDGLFHEMREILEASKQAAEVLHDERILGRIILQRARLDEIQDISLEEVLKSIDEAEHFAIKFNNWADLGEAWATRISSFRFLARESVQKGNLLEAEQLLEEGEKWAIRLLEEAQNTGDLHLKYLGAI